MFYNIVGLCPSKQMGGAGFNVQLWLLFKELVAESTLTQGKVNVGIENMGRQFLDGCGFDALYDPDDHEPWKQYAGKKPSPNARPLYEPRNIRVDWGEWGPEHISVPGNACGLDIGGGFGSPHGGRVLLPHNVDSVKQAVLLLVVFTFFADFLVVERLGKEADVRMLARCGIGNKSNNG